MKRILIVFTLILAGLMCQSVKAQITSPDTMVHRIFQTLKTKDEKGFVALYPNQEQMLRLFDRMIENLSAELAKRDTSIKKTMDETDFGELMIEQMKRKAAPEQLVKEYDRFAKNFRSIIKAGEDKGIDWSSISLANYTYDTTTANDDVMSKLFGNSEMKIMKGVLHFTSRNKPFSLNFKETMYLPEEKGWYGTELYGVRKSGENITNDKQMDNIRIDATEYAPALSSPLKPKTKRRTTSSTSTAKSKP